MSFKTIIGQAARGDDFLTRPDITNEIWQKLESGSNLLFVAPRRVGKSSILFNLLDNPKEKNIVIYYTSESVNSENEFYQKLFNHIIEKLSRSTKYKAILISKGKHFLSSIESVGKDGVKFSHDRSISYNQELNNLIKNMDLGEDKIIVLIDEFAQTVENIIKDENERAAIHFLQSKREIRQSPEIYRKLQFVHSGSIGLENIVSRLNAMNLIGDLTPIKIPPLDRSETVKLCAKIMNGSGVTFSEGSFDHLLKVIEWLIPFYFQIIMDEASKILDTKFITNKIIDQAVDNALKQRIYFENWLTRIRNAYKSEEFSFIKELLNITSEKHKITISEIYNLAIKFKLENAYNNLVNALKHDGYVNNEQDPKIYHFNSPLLREWWYRNVAN
jgi:hypothetical protein